MTILLQMNLNTMEPIIGGIQFGREESWVVELVHGEARQQEHVARLAHTPDDGCHACSIAACLEISAVYIDIEAVLFRKGVWVGKILELTAQDIFERLL